MPEKNNVVGSVCLDSDTEMRNLEQVGGEGGHWSPLLSGCCKGNEMVCSGTAEGMGC